MLTKEEFKSFVDNMRDSLPETERALQSENFINVMSNYNNAFDEIQLLNEKNATISKERDDILKVNGSLFQKIGFEKEKEKEIETEKAPTLKLEDIIDDKGDFIF